MRLKEEEN
jgi:dsDNA-binding SOS-regulon protein